MVAMGTPFWASGEPNDIGGYEGCLAIQSSTGYFNDYNCIHDVNVICQDNTP